MLNVSISRGTGVSSNRRRERGITIAMLALFIVVLFMIAALAIDVGVLYTARASAQHAADAAALAGAFTFVNTPSATQPSTAQNAAVKIAGQNSILGQTVTIAPADVNVDVPNRRVSVTVSRLAGSGVTTFFAKVIGINAVDVQTKATAEAAKKAAGGYCIKPIYIPNTALSTRSVPNACKAGEVIFDASGNLSAFALGQIGQTFTLWDDSKVPLMGPLSLSTDYQCAIENCLNQCGLSASQMACGSSIHIETTSNLGNDTRTAFQTLIGSPWDQWQGVGEYVSGGVVQDTSKSLVPVIVYDNCTQTIAPATSGQTISPIGFASVFIPAPPTGTIAARFVYGASCSGSPPGGTGPQAVPVRLVQTP